ncbi:MAG TPA: Asp-tRNA(Asn)/Glu-tRNA(Gln) amidotransferase subunit GatA [Firmicutes bacterium]|nr:Asp-tRNA(Asn)/Glu-tRNA(Gln) amidotransferase subunit GatA [Bacillota bacterium]
MELFKMTAAGLSRLLQAKEVSSVEVVQSFLDRIEQVEPQVKAFITISAEQALQAAREVDRRRTGDEQLHPLAGVPVAIKDNICTEGLRTTCASRMLEHFIPPYDATVAAVLRRCGLPVLGKTNLDEFATGSSTESSVFFITRNPWDLERVPGGSSGGSAAAVSAGMAPLALGSDTGGSVRQPAAFCGLTGLRPTYGRVSRYGLVALASSMDQIGPLALDATDCGLLLGLIAGRDLLDPTALPDEVPDYTANLDGALKGLRLGIIIEHQGRGFDPEITSAVKKAAEVLVGGGVTAEEISLPHHEHALPAYRLLCAAESSSNLGRYDGVRYGFCQPEDNVSQMFSRTRGQSFGPEVKRRILLGTYLLSEGQYEDYFLQAQKVRTLIVQDYREVFQKFDLLLGAVTPTSAFKLGEKREDPCQMALADLCLVGNALAGVPSISVPFGAANGLPVGVQLTAPPLGEDLLLKAAYFLEQRREPGRTRPRLSFEEEGGKD